MHRTPPTAIVLAAGLILGFLATADPATAQCEVERLTASDAQEGAGFGYAIAMHGERLVTGAPFADNDTVDAGRAYVFRREGTRWIEEARLTAPNPVGRGYFGASVSISGQRVVIGTAGSAGTANIFRHTGDDWIHEAEISASDATLNDWFGYSVAIDGDRIIVGAPFNSHVGNAAGSAYVFHREDLGWTEEAKLTASDAASGAEFGWSVAINAGKAVIGAAFDNGACPEETPNCSAGAAYVFTHEGTLWVEKAKLVATDPAAHAPFGSSVAIDAALVLVGAPDALYDSKCCVGHLTAGCDDSVCERAVCEDAGIRLCCDLFWGGLCAAVAEYSEQDQCHCGVRAGSANVFGQIATTWERVNTLQLRHPDGGTLFGESVSISDGHVAVGAQLSAGGRGSAYLFKSEVSGWTDAILLESNRPNLVAFGFSVATDGRYVGVGSLPGSELEDSGGAVYVFAVDGDDCNENGAIDECDIADSTSADLDENGVPDECEEPGPLGAAMELHAYCKAGSLKVWVTMPDETRDGDTVMINISGETMSLRVVRKTARYRVKTKSPEVTVCLTDSNRVDACRTVYCAP